MKIMTNRIKLSIQNDDKSIDDRVRFRCCSFAAAAAAISLSSTIVAAPAVAADRSTTVVAVVVATIDPEFRIQNTKIMKNRSVGRRSIGRRLIVQSKMNRSSAPLKNRVVQALTTPHALPASSIIKLVGSAIVKLLWDRSF